MIKPLQSDHQLIADIQRTVNQTEGFRIWWLGQSGFLIQWQGKHLLFDPYLSDSLTIKYAHTDKPHVRVSERVIDPALLTMIDVVTSSHNHTDHLDAETLLPIFKQNPDIQLVIPEANRTFVCERLGCNSDFPVGMNDGITKQVGDFTFHGVPAAHNKLERDEHGLWYDGMVETLKPFEVDVAFLPINGNKPERRVAGNLNAEEAAQLGKTIGAKLVIPHHYDLFSFNTEDPANFVAAAKQYATPHRVMQLGEGICYPYR